MCIHSPCPLQSLIHGWHGYCSLLCCCVCSWYLQCVVIDSTRVHWHCGLYCVWFTLTTLADRLSSCRIDVEGVVGLLKALSDNTSLRSLEYVHSVPYPRLIIVDCMVAPSECSRVVFAYRFSVCDIVCPSASVSRTTSRLRRTTICRLSRLRWIVLHDWKSSGVCMCCVSGVSGGRDQDGMLWMWSLS